MYQIFYFTIFKYLYKQLYGETELDFKTITHYDQRNYTEKQKSIHEEVLAILNKKSPNNKKPHGLDLPEHNNILISVDKLALFFNI